MKKDKEKSKKRKIENNTDHLPNPNEKLDFIIDEMFNESFSKVKHLFLRDDITLGDIFIILSTYLECLISSSAFSLIRSEKVETLLNYIDEIAVRSKKSSAQLFESMKKEKSSFYN